MPVDCLSPRVSTGRVVSASTRIWFIRYAFIEIYCSPSLGIGHHSRLYAFWFFAPKDFLIILLYNLLVLLLPKTFELLCFTIFLVLSRTRGRVFQKHAVRTKFDVYVFISSRRTKELYEHVILTTIVVCFINMEEPTHAKLKRI